MSFRGTWGVALLVVALATVGCGNGSGGSTTAGGGETTTALTKAELLEQAEAICTEVNSAVEAIEPKSPGATVRMADLYLGMVKSLKDLGNPQETEGRYGEYLRMLGELKTIEGELKFAAEHGSSKLEVMERLAESTLSAFELSAGEYGLEECRKGPAVHG